MELPSCAAGLPVGKQGAGPHNEGDVIDDVADHAVATSGTDRLVGRPKVPADDAADGLLMGLPMMMVVATSA